MQSESVLNTLNKSLTCDSNDDSSNEFMARVQTYIAGQKWIKKPIALSPAVCSQYGWKCIKPDLLECVTCSVKLSAHQPSISNFVAYKACIEKMHSDLKDSHGKHCPWPLTPSPESFVKMTLMPKEEALNQFLKRVKACLAYKMFLPKIDDSTNEWSLNEHHVIELCKMAGISKDESNQFGRPLVLLAATGWIISQVTEIEKTVFKCNSCIRSVNCDAFSLLEHHDSSDKENGSKTENAEVVSESNIQTKEECGDEPPSKRKRISFVIKKGEPFNPLHEHRPWCLWIFNGIEDYGSTHISKPEGNDIPGWKIFLKSLLRNVSENETRRKSPSKEQIRNVKNLLEKWT